MDTKFDDSDVSEKISGFGIGELGNVPETTPYDELIATEINRKSKQITGKFEAHDLNTNKIHEFDTLDKMIEFMRVYVVGSMRDEEFCLFAPGYSVGDLYTLDTGEFRLTWRRAIKLTEPKTYCDECGGDVKNGRCIVCGETDMIRTTWTTWDNHKEILSRH